MFGMDCWLARAAEMQGASNWLRLGRVSSENFFVSDPVGYGFSETQVDHYVITNVADVMPA